MLIFLKNKESLQENSCLKAKKSCADWMSESKVLWGINSFRKREVLSYL